MRDWIFLLKLEAGVGMFTIAATEDILAEALYHLRRRYPKADGGMIASLHDRLVENIDQRVEQYAIDDSYLGSDPNDAHVHAAAVACRADIVLTCDRGFAELRPDQLDQLPYEVQHPDDFFILVDDSSPDIVERVVIKQATYHCKREGEANLPEHLSAAGCPKFAVRVRAHLAHLAVRPGVRWRDGC